MRNKTTLLMIVVLGWMMGSPLVFAGPNIVAIGNYGDVPFQRAEGRYSLPEKEIIYSFSDPQFDFGRVVVRSNQALSVVRNNFVVGFTGSDLRIGGQGSTAQVQEVEVWLKLKGQLRPETIYDWEIEVLRSREAQAEAIPAVIPAFWADGQPIGVDVTITNPTPDPDNNSRLQLPHGSVKTPAFEKQTGAAWIVLQVRNPRAGFALVRFSFREAETASSGDAQASMPVPVRYVPISNQVEDQISDVVGRSITALERLQAPDGSWGTGTLNEKVQSTSGCALALAEMKPKNERVTNAMKWVAAQTPTANESFTVDTVGRRLMLLSRFGTMSDYGPVIQKDAQFLVDAQLDDGGWGERSPKAPGTAEFVLSQHLYSFHTLYALREARFAGAEIEPRVFRNAMDYWTDAQAGDGGFTSRLSKYGSISRTSVGFTAAGTAGLLTALDMAAGFGSKKCSAYLSSKKQLQTIDKGLNWLNEEYGDEQRGTGPFAQNTNAYFESLWLILFGEVSGVNRIAGKNYFADEAEQLLQNYDPSTGMFGLRGQAQGLYGQGNFTEAPSPGNTSLALWILGTGNAPTVVQRIIAGSPNEQWDEYRGDIPHLVRFMAKSMGAHFNWRRTAITRDVRELAEVPLLFLSVVGPVDWSDAQWKTIREYCLAGGTVVIDISDEADAQRAGISATLAKTFPEYTLAELTNEAGVFAMNSAHKPIPGIKAMSNGFRDFLFVTPRSWSCLWQSYDTRKPDDSFLFMEDLLQYATDGTPPRSSFARSTYAVASASSRAMKAAALQVGSDVPAYPNLIDTMSRLMQSNYRMRVDEAKVSEADLIWVSVAGSAAPKEADLKQLREALRSGKYLFADVVSGNQDWDTSFRAAIKSLDPGVVLEQLRRNDPVFTGEIAGTQGFDVTRVGFRKALHDRFSESGSGDLYGIYLNGRRVGIYSAQDISSGIGYHYFPGCRGILPEGARQVAMNMFLSVYGQKIHSQSRAEGK